MKVRKNGGRKSMWTTDKDEQVRTRYPHEDNEQLANELGCSIRTLCVRAKFLGIGKTPEAHAAIRAKTVQKVRETYLLRGGRPSGEKHWLSKLTDHEIELIRQLREGGMHAAEIASKFEITPRYVYKVANYEKR